MGNQACQDCSQLRMENEAYGLHQLVEGTAVIEKLIPYKPDLERTLVDQLERRKYFANPNIVQLLSYSIKKEEKQLRIQLQYNYYPCKLAHFLREYPKPTEEQLLLLMNDINSALKMLYGNEIRHGCVNFSTILYDRECQGFKLTDVSCTTNTTSYELAMRGDKQQYLNEKLLASMGYKAIDPSYEIEEDLFSLGAIVLTIVNPKCDLYEWREGIASLNRWEMEKCITRMDRNFSSRLSRKVKQCLKGEIKGDLVGSLREFENNMRRVMNKMNRFK